MADHEDASAKAGAPKSKLKSIGNIVLLALGPIMAIAAIGVAGYTYMNAQNGVKLLDKSQARVEELNASLQATKAELDKLKLSMAHDKGIQDEAHKKLDARLSVVIQNITPLQKKLKIKPTLEEQLGLVAEGGAPIPASVPVSMVAHPAEEKSKHESVKLSRPEPEAKTHATNHPSHPAPEHEAAKGEQIKALKDALQKFNKQ